MNLKKLFGQPSTRQAELKHPKSGNTILEISKKEKSALLGRELGRLHEGKSLVQDHLHMEASGQLKTNSFLYCRSINWRVKTKRHRLV